jgi:multidrug resistance efflux pump
MLTKFGIPALALFALTFAGWSVTRMKPEGGQLPPPVTPPTAAYARQVGATGLVEASSENINISIPVPGLVTRVHVQAGDRVRRGATLLELDGRDLRAELALREAAVRLAATRLERLESSPRPEELPPARARVSEAQAQLRDAETQLKLIESVKDPRAVRTEDVERRRRAVDAAKARVEQSIASLKLLEAGTWKPDLEVARAEVDQARRQVERIQADLARLTVTAPIDGQILQVKVRAGEYAQVGPLAQPLMLMGATGQLHVRADIDEKDAWRFKQGAPAQATVRGEARQRWPLAFVRVEPYVVPKKSLTGDATERVDTRVLQVIFSLPQDAPVYPGQQMDISIEAQ